MKQTTRQNTIRPLLAGLMASLLLASTADYSHLLIWLTGYDWQYDETSTSIVRWTVYALNSLALICWAYMFRFLPVSNLVESKHRWISQAACGLWCATAIFYLVLGRPGFFTMDEIMFSPYVLQALAILMSGIALLTIKGEKPWKRIIDLTAGWGTIFTAGCVFLSGYCFFIHLDHRLWLTYSHSLYIGYLTFAAVIAALIYFNLKTNSNGKTSIDK